MISSTTFPLPFPLFPSLPKSKTRLRFSIPSLNSSTLRASLSDPSVLQIAETLEDSTSNLPISTPLQKLRDISSQSILSLSWPSRKDEPFRFTDTSFIKHSQIQPSSLPPPPPQYLESHFSSFDTQSPSLVIVDGHIVPSASQLSELPNGVYIGSVSNLSSSDAIMKKVTECMTEFHDGDLFWSLNGIGAPDVIVLFVPSGCRIENPLHLRFLSLESSDHGSEVLPVSNPRVLVLVEKGGEIGIVEEYCGIHGDKCYWANSAMEIMIREEAKVTHSYIQQESTHAAHIKWTVVRQVNLVPS